MRPDYYLDKWSLVADGPPIKTHSSHLLPVVWQGRKAMLKVAIEEEEKRGAALMRSWAGDGAAQVFEYEDGVLLMERATGTRSLLTMAAGGQDDKASRILCGAAARLHAPGRALSPGLVPLKAWFRELWPVAAAQGGLFATSAGIAGRLLSAEQGTGVLHGDIHHGNVLDFGNRGWLAIDPKGLVGERGFDFANIFCNGELHTVASPGRLQAQLDVVSAEAGLEQTRLLAWILAYAGLSAAWFVNAGEPGKADLSVAAIAAAELVRRNAC